MSSVVNALMRATVNLFHPRIFWLWSWPLLVASIFWWVVGAYFWTPASGWILVNLPVADWQNWLEASRLQTIADGVESVINVLIFTILIIVTSMILTALFAMQELVNFVAKRYYPDMDRAHGGSVVGSLRAVASTFAVFILIWVVTLPLWFIGIGLLVPLLAATYMNQRLFCYDALTEHAEKAELDELLVADRPARWGLGLLTGLIQFVPILNFFSPTLTALAFIHFELGRLSRRRQQMSVKQAVQPED
ncbi:MAG: EI24 domain-containing protein [Nitrosomonas sp.]|nr:EI24 domain-containing protein [Nitrosomonas sp.]MCC7134854.1 EI24 domain-containing protein [Nitrosomonas sp.]